MIIYCTKNLINGKIYIGKDQKNNPKYLGSGKILKQAIAKYGRENFEKVVLQECFTKDELNVAEKFWIKELRSQQHNIGYNIADGGTGGKTVDHPWNLGIKREPWTEEQRKRQSDIMIEKYRNGEIVNGKLGKVAWNKGIPNSDEANKKISDKNKGKIVTQAVRGRISATMKGKKPYDMTPEIAKKISNSLTGRKKSAESIAKSAKANKGNTKCAGPVVVCPYCNKEGKRNAMMRWHFENCKHKIL